MTTELTDFIMKIADSYQNARLPESAAVFRQDLEM